MNSLTHLFFTLSLARLLKLDGASLIYAILFGVVIDVDHVIRIPKYLKQHGFKIVRGYPWATPLQKPISYLLVVPLSILLKNFVPVPFFSLHLFLDWIRYDVIRTKLWPVRNKAQSGYGKPELIFEISLTLISMIIFILIKLLFS